MTPTAAGTATERPRLGELLVATGAITAEQLREALGRQQQSGRPLGQVLVEDGYVLPTEVAMALADQHGGLLRTEYGFATGHGEMPAIERIEVAPAPPADEVELTALRARVAELDAALGVAAQQRVQVESTIAELQAENARLRAATAPPVPATDRHAVFFRRGDRTMVIERQGPPPAAGDTVTVDGRSYTVLGVRAAPLPGAAPEGVVTYACLEWAV